MNLVESLRRAIVRSGLTHYRIAQDAGITPPMIDRFVRGERDLRLETASKIAEVLGLNLVENEQRKKVSRKTADKKDRST